MKIVTDFILGCSKITADVDCSHEIKKKKYCPLEEKLWSTYHIKKQRYNFANKVASSPGYDFFSVVLYGCESWTIKKTEHQRIDAFELWCWRRCLSPLDCKEIQSAHPKGNQSWIFIGRTDVEAETPILWSSDEKNWLTGKDPEAGKDWSWEKGMTEDEMVGCHHRLNEHEFE